MDGDARSGLARSPPPPAHGPPPTPVGGGACAEGPRRGLGGPTSPAAPGGAQPSVPSRRPVPERRGSGGGGTLNAPGTRLGREGGALSFLTLMGWGDLGKAKEVTPPGRGPFSVPAEAQDVTLLPGLPWLTSLFSLSGAGRPRCVSEKLSR